MAKKCKIQWKDLGFSYIKTDFRYLSKWENGGWDDGRLVRKNTLTLSEGSPALHYGQQCFEGLKAYKTQNGGIQLFRPDQNARRMINSCRRLLMPEVSVDKFIDACTRVIKANLDWVPPYGTGATLYLRPYIIGVGDNIGIKPASQYIFGVFCTPVGPYYKGELSPVSITVSEYDRAAPKGTGSIKVGGNYAASLYPHKLAVEGNFTDCIYLDPKTHTKIEEVGTANFFGIIENNKFVTPASDSILPSITKMSLLEIAITYLGMEVEERDVLIDKIDEFKEIGACGTAAVITPINKIEFKGKIYLFNEEGKVGPVTKKLYEILTEIQFGDIDSPSGWIKEIR